MLFHELMTVKITLNSPECQILDICMEKIFINSFQLYAEFTFYLRIFLLPSSLFCLEIRIFLYSYNVKQYKIQPIFFTTRKPIETLSCLLANNIFCCSFYEHIDLNSISFSKINSLNSWYYNIKVELLDI